MEPEIAQGSIHRFPSLPKATAMADRRVRPIYDAIDVHNYKQALKLCNQFLKKKDASHQLVSVRGSALYRTNWVLGLEGNQFTQTWQDVRGGAIGR